jgi:hypothetical protein
VLVQWGSSVAICVAEGSLGHLIESKSHSALRETAGDELSGHLIMTRRT